MKENLNKFRITYNLKIKKKMNKKTKKKGNCTVHSFFYKNIEAQIG